MAKPKGKKLSWVASTDTDVVSYNVYCAFGSSVTYDSAVASVPATQTEYVLPGAFNMQVEGDYSLAVSAVDSSGNESDLSVSVTSFFGFLVPSAPTNLRILDL
jgi:hypothetical protein